MTDSTEAFGKDEKDAANTTMNEAAESADEMSEPLRRRRKNGANGNIRSRFISETTRLMRQHGLDGVSTRSICDAVGVTAPSLYHHFGDMRSLQESAVDHAYSRFMERWQSNVKSSDPLVRIRAGWDTHVAFSCDEPVLYSIIAMQNNAGTIPKQIKAAHQMLIEDFREVETKRTLNYPPEVAAQLFTAGCLGAASICSLLKTQELPNIVNLSEVMREDSLRCILGPPIGQSRGR